MNVLQNIILDKNFLENNYLENLVQLNQSREKEFEIIFYLLFHYNFRINELIKIKSKDLIYDYKIIIHISKSKTKEIIRDEFIYKEIKNYFTNHSLNNFTLTYIQFYAWMYKTKNNFIIFSKTKNNKVTHSFRYKNTEKLLNYSQDEKVIKANLHHNSRSSQKFYLPKKKN